MSKPRIPIWMHIKAIFTLLFCALFLGNLPFQNIFLEHFCIFLVSIVLVLSLFQIRGISLLLGCGLFGTGILLLWSHQAPLSVWMEGIQRNIYILVMFVLTPLINIPISRGGYNEALQNFLEKFLERKSSFSLFISSLSALVGVIMNIAAVPLMLAIGSQQKQLPSRRLLCTSVSRGYSLSIFWGPTFAAVALPLELTGAQWVDYFPFALGISLFALFSMYFFERLQERKQYKNLPACTAPLSSSNRKKLKELTCSWVIILSFIILVSSATHMNTITVVSLSCLVFPLLWMLLIHQFDVYKQEITQNYLARSLPQMSSEIVLFAGAGFLAAAFDFSHVLDFLPGLLASCTGGHALPFIILSLGIIVVLCTAGIHAMIPVIVLGSAITPEVYGLTPLSFTFVLTAGWALSIFLSGSSTVSIFIASFARKDTFAVSAGWNWKYGIYMFLLFCTSIYIINLISH